MLPGFSAPTSTASASADGRAGGVGPTGPAAEPGDEEQPCRLTEVSVRGQSEATTRWGGGGEARQRNPTPQRGALI